MNLQNIIIKTAIIISILLYLLPTQAQKRGMSDWHCSTFEYEASDAQEKYVYSVKIPTSLKIEIYDNEGNLANHDNILSSYLASFFSEPESYRYGGEVALVYGIFQMGNFNDKSVENISRYREQILPYFNDTVWFERGLRIMTPIMKKAWSLLDTKTKDVYIDIFKYTRNYINGFDYVLEHENLKKMQENGNSGNFASGKYGKAKSFLYRRIDNAKNSKGNWTQNWIIKIMERIAKILNI